MVLCIFTKSITANRSTLNKAVDYIYEVKQFYLKSNNKSLKKKYGVWLNSMFILLGEYGVGVHG
jgi:hypothetical protein